MDESYRRTNEPGGLEVEPSTAGASGGRDLEEKEWEWATPISTDFLVRQPAQLYCQKCEQALYVTGGEIELWEMALDAKRHALEEH